IFHRMGIDTKSVLEAAGTKWNFLPFSPGLVGGHCIGVDPYYLTYKAEALGYHSQIILSGRRINDDMGAYVGREAVKLLIAADIAVKDAKVAILGFTFKENCPDTRNTKVIDIYNELGEYGITPLVFDPEADAEEAERLYGIRFVTEDALQDLDAVIVAVSHESFRRYDRQKLDAFFNASNKTRILADLKGIYRREDFAAPEYAYWRL
ncbi:MAG: nucleotide sugar dehydrogenase, partial [Lachnospiraceae bacterium]|nr:nucleotide sugar dehydrogenase [Lachnospiraceae bacterium]